MDNNNNYTNNIYDLFTSIEATPKKYFIDRWGTVYSHNPNLPEKEEEAPEKEPTSSGWEEDRR